jgi:uncharacterized protein (DUF1697 family)
MKYCAFLRGVNVKGTAMKMAEVCQVFADEGMKQVSSVLASGNILFSSDKTPGELTIILEKAMADHFNYEAFLFLRDDKEIKEMVESNPFEKSEEKHIYVFVTTAETEINLLEEFKKGRKDINEQAKVEGSTFYWQVPKGNTLDSDFGKILGKKAFKSHITSRNINTFEKIMKELS